jgi:hypothetical protein
MNQLIDSIFTELKARHSLSKAEIERIVDTQFKLTVDHMESSDLRSVKWIHLGKIRPSDYYEHKINNERKAVHKEL